MRPLILTIAAALIPASALAYECPDGYRYAPNLAGQGYCIVDLAETPDGMDAYCHYTDDGYQGFSFPEAGSPTYTCPEGSRQTTNGAGLGFCLWEDLDLPANGADAYCHYIDDGYFGFSWDLCPEGLGYWGTQDYAYCYTWLDLPDGGADPYTHYLDDGYMGFSFDDDPTYECPEGTRRAPNGAGLTFCLWEDIETEPGGSAHVPYDAYLDWGVIGYFWWR